jgi:hypothetical protein
MLSGLGLKGGRAASGLWESIGAALYERHDEVVGPQNAAIYASAYQRLTRPQHVR